MKITARVATGIAAALAAAALCGAAAGCSGSKTGEAYGLVHGANYVGYAKISVKGNKIKDLTLTEVCLPTHVKAGEGVAEEDKVGEYYKTVSYGNVTLVYDAEANGYTAGGKTLKEYFATEANAKAYYDAVVSNSVKVTIGGEKKGGILDKKALSKEENGYWTKQDGNGADYSRWKWNRDNTVEYVKSNGVGNLLKLTKSETKETDPKGTNGAGVTFWYDGKVSTGATWADFNTVKEGSLSYARLITNAYDAAK